MFDILPNLTVTQWVSAFFALVVVISFASRYALLSKSDFKALCTMTSFGMLHVERAKFMGSLDIEVAGVRYKGRGATHLLNKELKTITGGGKNASDPARHHDLEDLWKTTSGDHFLVKGVFLQNGLKSEVSRLHVWPLTREAALIWAQQNALGRYIDHIG